MYEQDAKKYIKKINRSLLSDDPSVLRLVSDKTTIEQYFESTREVFKEFSRMIASAKTDEERKVLIRKMCDINALYSIQLKLGYALPADLAEIAHDFDNPDYPGVSYISDTIREHGYSIQRAQ